MNTKAITVVHARTCSLTKPTYYIGRGEPTAPSMHAAKLGNPWSIGPSMDRNKVIELFKRHMDGGNCNPQLERIFEHWKALGFPDIQLACYCAPRACHGDVIAQWLMDRKKNSERAHDALQGLEWPQG